MKKNLYKKKEKVQNINSFFFFVIFFFHLSIIFNYN